MDEIADGLFKPFFRVILWLLRVLQFLAWDLMFSYVGWSIGWAFFRLISFGNYPQEGIGDLESCRFAKAVFIEITGLVTLGGLIILITSLA